MESKLKRGFEPLLLLCLLATLSALSLSSWFLWQEVKTTRALVSYVNATVAGIKPWAYSLGELQAALEDSRQAAMVEGTSSSVAKQPKPLEVVERRYGDPEAQFEIVEYSDFECSYCKTFFPVPKALVDGSRGNISLVFKHVPIHGDASRREAYAAECAGAQGGNDAFFRMADAIFQSTSSNGTGTNKPLSSLADEIGLNGQELAACVDSNFYLKKVRADFKEAIDLGIEVTPTTLIRHKPTGQTVLIKEAVAPDRLLSAMGGLVKGKVEQK
ncbi:TPA: DsbA family protein [Pseudomonas aeruginosa]